MRKIPLKYKGKEVGEVVELYVEGTKVCLSFHINEIAVLEEFVKRAEIVEIEFIFKPKEGEG